MSALDNLTYVGRLEYEKFTAWLDQIKLPASYSREKLVETAVAEALDHMAKAKMPESVLKNMASYYAYNLLNRPEEAVSRGVKKHPLTAHVIRFYNDGAIRQITLDDDHAELAEMDGCTVDFNEPLQNNMELLNEAFNFPNGSVRARFRNREWPIIANALLDDVTRLEALESIDTESDVIKPAGQRIMPLLEPDAPLLLVHNRLSALSQKTSYQSSPREFIELVEAQKAESSNRPVRLDFFDQRAHNLKFAGRIESQEQAWPTEDPTDLNEQFARPARSKDFACMAESPAIFNLLAKEEGEKTPMVSVFYAKQGGLGLEYSEDERRLTSGDPIAADEIKDILAKHYAHMGTFKSWAALEKLFMTLQGETWSPQGEARSLVRERESNHTSMSKCDIIIIDDQVFHCTSFSWAKTKIEGSLDGIHPAEDKPFQALKQTIGASETEFVEQNRETYYHSQNMNTDEDLQSAPTQ